MNKSIFKAIDIRGIYPQDINPETATTIGKACAHIFPEGTLVIAYDARHGNTVLMQAVIAAINAEAEKLGKKFTLVNIGLSTTPMYYFTVCDLKAVGGCMITASHNPKEYNGMKIVRAGAIMVPGTEILSTIESLSLN